jgi:transcriptional regulator with GAF, ATPase, and Fis domain/CHASE2 domain-containing sensor protein
MLIPKRYIIISVLCIFALCSLLSILPFPWNEPINNTMLDWQFKIRGARQISDNIILVYIGDEDIKTLDVWPISRDYYSYAIHALQTAGAKVIGIDVLFANRDRRHPEYDQTLINFARESTNLCLPMKFSELNQNKEDPNKLLVGENPTFPFKDLRRDITALGFSNLGKEAFMRKVPLMVQYNDSLMPSFGLELARIYHNAHEKIQLKGNQLSFVDTEARKLVIQLNSGGRLHLNHFGDVEDINSIGFLDLLKTFTTYPDSLDMKSKLVLLSVTASGISTVKATPFSAGLPASLIHITVAENLIEQNYLRGFSHITAVVCIIIMIALAYFSLSIKRKTYLFTSGILMLLVYWTICFIIFTSAYHIVPVFYPSLVFIVTLVYFSLIKEHIHKREEANVRDLLQQQISIKEIQLQATKKILSELQEQLSDSEQIRQTAEERRYTIARLESEVADLKSYLLPPKRELKTKFPDVVYSEQSKMKEVLDLAAKVSQDDISVLISGETGTGKELIAQIIHKNSKRNKAPFVAINCGALSETLLDSELYGHEKGSFTGAQARRLGRFELADGGTIFLDEITETSQSFQTRLLRVLQEGTFERLGGEHTLKVNLRIIAATNKDIQEEIKNKRFRTDLFYRLNGFHILIPPLRERCEDIPHLASHFLKKYDYSAVSEISNRAMQQLQSYNWPGNVRELENTIRRAALLAQSDNRSIIQAAHLPKEILKYDIALDSQRAYKPLEEQILEMLRAQKFSHAAISQTAKALGNRDRGTITEYFRGTCFEYLVKADFDIMKAAIRISDSTDKEVINRVASKINEYLANLRNVLLESPMLIYESEKMPAIYQGLAKKYHIYLKQVLDFLTHEKK